jgi:hypothetical protein
VAVALLWVGLVAPAAGAQERATGDQAAAGTAHDRAAPVAAASPTPSGAELRQMYPLDAATAAPTVTATPTASVRQAAPAASVTPAATAQPAPPPSRPLLQLAVVLTLAVLAFAAGLLALRRRGARRPQIAATLPPLRYAAGPLLAATGAATMGSNGPRPPRRAAARASGGPPGNPVPRPPDPRREWTAEIEWRHTDWGSRFAVVARTPGDKPVVLAQSVPLEWPPTTPTAVQALTDAAGDLEAALAAAGWHALEPGDAWYAKRFGWRAAPAVHALPDPDPPPRTGRFTRPAWPEGTELLPRCEIEWHAGYVNSRFEAVVHRPNRRRGRAVGASGAFKWLLMGEPDPASAEHRTELHGLASALAAAGWEPAGRGADWYAERFVWRREDEPPERVEPAAVKEDEK